MNKKFNILGLLILFCLSFFNSAAVRKIFLLMMEQKLQKWDFITDLLDRTRMLLQVNTLQSKKNCPVDMTSTAKRQQ